MYPVASTRGGKIGVIVLGDIIIYWFSGGHISVNMLKPGTCPQENPVVIILREFFFLKRMESPWYSQPNRVSNCIPSNFPCG